MSERIKRELALVQAAYGEIEVDADLRWFVIRHWELVAGWNKQHTRLLVLIPPGYPITAPDNFFTEPDLAVKGGGAPGSTSGPVQQAGQSWLQFSYHLEGGEWRPEQGHNLLTFLAGVARRLREVS
jgi:hypothetical protein